MNIVGRILFLFFLIATISSAFGQEVKGKERRAILREVRQLQRETGRQQPKNPRIFGFPSIWYSPETSFAFGGSGFLLYQDTVSQSSSRLLLNAYYTLNDQVIVDAPFQAFFRHKQFFLEGQVGFLRYPYLFAGIGNNHSVKAVENYDASFSRVRVRGYRKAFSNWYLGFSSFYQNFTMLGIEPNGLLANDVRGNSGGVTSAFGLALLYDSRNYSFSPTKGMIMRSYSSHAATIIGSDFEFNTYVLDIRKYVSLSAAGDVLAFNYYGEHTNGEVPFNQLAQMGGGIRMRGFRRGVFRDKHLSVMQLELRSRPFWGFLGVHAFGGLGSISDVGTELYTVSRGSYGGGLRLLLDKANRTYVRIDMGFGENTSGFYFNIGEAF